MIRHLRRLFGRATPQTGDTVVRVKAAEIGVHRGLHDKHVGTSTKLANRTVIAAIEAELVQAERRGVPSDHPELVAHRAELRARRALDAARK